MKYIALCDTPYQVLSAISFAYEKKVNNEEVDIVIDTQRCPSANMEEIAINLSHIGVFSKVYRISNLQEKHKLVKPAMKVFEWIFPSFAYKCMTKRIKKDNYDAVAVSGPFSTQKCLIAAYPNVPIYFIEDGLSSYTGRIGIRQLSWRGKIAQKLLKYGPEKIYPNACFVYHPDFYEGEYRNILQKLRFPIEKIDDLRKLYGFDVETIDSLYCDKKIIYLSQFVNLNDYEKKKQTEIIKDLFLNYSNTMIVRPHPRDINISFIQSPIDTSGTLWELICANYINESSILVGNCSTAQFTPKLLFDKEPYLIIIKNEQNKHFEEPLINRLKNIYASKQKIVCVNNKAEVLTAIERSI